MNYLFKRGLDVDPYCLRFGREAIVLALLLYEKVRHIRFASPLEGVIYA